MGQLSIDKYSIKFYIIIIKREVTMKSNFTYHSNAKFELSIRFKTVESAHVFAWDYDCECRDHAEDWVDVWLDKKSDLNKFVKIVMNDPDVEHFSVSKF